MPRLLTSFAEQLQSQHDRWILWSPVPVAAGIAFYFSLTSEPPVLLGAVLAAVLAPLLWAFYGHRLGFLIVTAVFLAVLGFTAAQWRTASVMAPVLEKQSYPATLRGKIVEVEPLPRAYRIVLEDIAVMRGKIWQDPLPARVRVKMKNNDKTVPVAGAVVDIHAVLLPLSPPVMPGAFDFQRHAFFKGLGATGYALGDLQVVTPNDGGDFYFKNLRRAIRDRIYAVIPDKDNAAIITAFMIGEDDAISKKDWETARLSGIAHLIAISGSHFILIAGFPFLLVRAFLAAIPYVALRWPVKKIAAVVAMAVSVFYMLLIGAPIPAQRAVIMTCVVMTAIILDRNPFTLRLAAFAAMILFLLEPESVMGPSFQMSFAAVVALIAFYESTRDGWRHLLLDANWAQRYAVYLLGCFLTTFVASIATAPYALYHFARMPLLAGQVANMVAVPVSSFITFPVGLMGCALMPFGLEKGPLWLTEKSLDAFMYVAEAVSTWPHAGLEVSAWPGWVLGMISLGGLWICIWQGRLRLLGLLPVLAGIAAIALVPRPDILVAANGKLAAVRDADGKLLFSEARRESFIRNQWIRSEDRITSAGGKHVWWPKTGTLGDRLECDDGICTYRAKGTTAVFVPKAEDVARVCAGADIIFTPQRLTPRPETCPPEAVVIDRNNLRENGAQSIYLEDGGQFRLRAVQKERGDRPWTGRRRNIAPDKRG